MQHYASIRTFGDPFEQRLLDVLPIQIPGLFQPYIGKQCANLYDSFLGNLSIDTDLFNMRIASLEMGGWDTHRAQRLNFERNISDLFGGSMALDSLRTALGLVAPPDNDINPNTVYVFNSDFGRQLKANGDRGTDHGRGNYMILIGDSVNGGVYGEMFPRSEIADLGGGETRYDQPGTDIEGLTSFERVLAQVCDWVEPGSGVQVFPNTALNDSPGGPILEDGVDLKDLFVPDFI